MASRRHDPRRVLVSGDEARLVLFDLVSVYYVQSQALP